LPSLAIPPPTLNLNLNIQPVDIVAQFEKLHAAINEKIAKESASITRQQLALPGGETIADSGAETCRAEQQTSKNELTFSRSFSTVRKIFAAKRRNST
jgi:hypothetical protein